MVRTADGEAVVAVGEGRWVRSNVLLNVLNVVGVTAAEGVAVVARPLDDVLYVTGSSDV